METERLRESVIAGSWYPDNPDSLKKDIKSYLDQAEVSPVRGELIGLLVPHAGYFYSGGVAAHAYKLLQDQDFDRVVIVAPSHHARFSGASVYTLGGYQTPLGVVPLDKEMVYALLKHSDAVHFVPEADESEHSLEIQLPFLQYMLGDFRLTPVILGDQSYEFCLRFADILASECSGKKILLIASSDLSHFHPYSEARRLDRLVLDRVAAFDALGLSQDLKKGESEACGGGPMISVMLAARKLGAGMARVLHYANSGDISGDMRGVVGYMAAALVQASAPEGSATVKNKVGVDLGLSDSEKETLHEIASNAIRDRCLGRPERTLPDPGGKLSENRGAFVCVKKQGELRGCIGMIEPRAPLFQTVRDMSLQAAFSDPRFCSLAREELNEISIEISALTPLQRIKDVAEIEIGTHGLMIRRGYESGLLLPQVAVEHHWDTIEFLEWTCRKAGLPQDAWREPDTELYVFSADVF